MKKTEIIMGMPITIEIVGERRPELFNILFEYFRSIDKRFSTYKPQSEISKINDGLDEKYWSEDMKMVFSLCEQTRKQTNGFFNIKQNGKLDPSGLVKGLAISEAAKILDSKGIENYYIEAGGDIQAKGRDRDRKDWKIGIKNPYNQDEIVKVVSVNSAGIATSGTYIRGQHIYDPFEPSKPINEVKSITVIAKNIYDADRFATAAFAMGRSGIEFIESIPGFEAFMIDDKKTATYTSGFERYAV